MGATWDEAVAAVRPEVIDVKTDPNIGPLQSHITFAQAKVLASAQMEDDPTRGNVIVEMARQVLGALLPGHHQR
jgi:pyruvate dehydrogenase (quinone)